MAKQLHFDFNSNPASVTTEQISSPSGYKGLYRFHKYWGKKPYEPLAYIIEQLTQQSDIILDPFCGSGTAGREALLRSRKFIGIDINPVAVELTRLLIHPPSPAELLAAIRYVERETKATILSSYLLEDGHTLASHYLWNEHQLQRVWVVGSDGSRIRQEFHPTDHDRALSTSYAAYKSERIRHPRFFTNSRINASPTMKLGDLLTGRAQRNLDLLSLAIDKCPKDTIPALRLCLTAASGQTTKMVFAVSGRGKTTGSISNKVEVGSWVIGYWRPKLHFEVNVWNCFERRASRLLKAVLDTDPLTATKLSTNPMDVIHHMADASVLSGDCRLLMQTIPDKSIQLVITDPPHSDRMPYLELSELWNSILGYTPDFQREIVISNAKERNKTYDTYTRSMTEFLYHVPRILKSNGLMLIFYNARNANEWDAFKNSCHECNPVHKLPLKYLGFFPCNYSAGSVVQDNRKGSLKHDLALIFARRDHDTLATRPEDALATIPGWSSALPTQLQHKSIHKLQSGSKTVQ